MCIIHVCVHCASCVLRLFYRYLLRRCIINDADIHILIFSYSPCLNFELPASLMPRKGCGEKFLFREALRWVEETWPAPPLQLNLNLQHFSEIQNIFFRNIENIFFRNAKNIFHKYRKCFVEIQKTASTVFSAKPQLTFSEIHLISKNIWEFQFSMN